MATISEAVIRATGTRCTIHATTGDIAGHAGLRRTMDMYGDDEQGGELLTRATLACSVVGEDAFEGLTVPDGQHLAGRWYRGRVVSTEGGAFVVSLLRQPDE